MLLDDLRHVLRPHAAVPDLLRVHDHSHAPRALVEATGRVGPDPPLETAIVQQALEGIAYLLAPLVRAAPLRIPGLPAIDADEDVAVEMWRAHPPRLAVQPVRREPRARGRSALRLADVVLAG